MPQKRFRPYKLNIFLQLMLWEFHHRMEGAQEFAFYPVLNAPFVPLATLEHHEYTWYRPIVYDAVVSVGTWEPLYATKSTIQIESVVSSPCNLKKPQHLDGEKRKSQKFPQCFCHFQCKKNELQNRGGTGYFSTYLLYLFSTDNR